MAKKSVKTTLFNKNHITITKESNMKNVITYVDVRNIITYEKNFIPREKQIIKCESPLGFYYNKETYIQKNNNYSNLRVIEVILSSEKYIISYLLHYNQNSISNSLRPWDVCENEKSMQEHFIFTLKEIIDKILNIAEENKLVIKTNYPYEKQDNKAFKWLKDTLYIELFGSTKGIRFQTDKEKIISHGFDLKTSFRNIK